MNGKKGKAPAFQFYPSDWLTDPSLRLCSWETRGVWMDMLCLMFLSPQPGFLIVGKRSLTKKEVQIMVKLTPKKFEKVWNELLDYNILKVNENGCYFNSRMVKDEALRQIRRENGHKGGNPTLIKKVEALDNQNNNQVSNQKTTPSSASSSSSSSSPSGEVVSTEQNSNEKVIESVKPEKKKSPPIAPAPPEHKLQELVIKDYKEVAKLKTQLTVDNCEKLLTDFSWEEVEDVLSRMDNYKKLLTSYKSVYLTANNWLKDGKKRAEQNKSQGKQPGGNKSFEDSIGDF